MFGVAAIIKGNIAIETPDTPVIPTGINLIQVPEIPTGILVNIDSIPVIITWINSTTYQVTKHKVYRDDILLGEVLVGDLSTWSDATAVTGASYKYEVQASVEDIIQSEKEVVGVNVENVTISNVDIAIINTISTSNSWTPTQITNTGTIITWEVTGGVIIPPQTTNTPVFDLSGNTGTAIITVSSTNFIGLTTFSVDFLLITSLEISKMTDLTFFSCKGDNILNALDITELVELTSLTFRTQILADIDLSQNTKLINLWGYANNLATIDLTNNPDLALVQLDNNLLLSNELDNIIITLAAGIISNGELRLNNNTGNITYNVINEYNILISRGWIIDIPPPSSIPTIPTGINLIEIVNTPTGINLIEIDLNAFNYDMNFNIK